MGLIITPKNALPDWIKRLREDYRMVGPKSINGHHVFGEIHSADQLDLDYPSTILPPRKFLLPQCEAMISFDMANTRQPLEPTFEKQPLIIFGVHTCDLHAIELLDRAFSQGFVDQHYRSRRSSTTIVSIECLRPCSQYSFCKSMGTLSVPEDFDLHLTDLGESIAIDVGSQKGAALLWHLVAFRDATEEDYQTLQKVMGEKWSRFQYQLDFDVTELPSLLTVSYESDLWEELGDRCLACGSCNIVCPTCYCFNVIDEVDFHLQKGTRYRIWDSCQLDHFAMVAGGHDFRSNRAARLRHRFFRKGKYLFETFGKMGCVGCGRCAQACLANISPIEVFNELHKRKMPVTSEEEEVMV